MFQNLQDYLPNVPVNGWLAMKNIPNVASGCSLYPDILDIEYMNSYCQIFKISDETNDIRSTYHLYGAYFGKILKETMNTFYL